MPAFSLCMIVKNEEKVLKRCLESAAALFDEIVICDTGSTDKTKTIAAGFTDKIYDFELQLRNAKNAGDEHTAGEYVRKVLGEEFEVPEKQVDVSENRFRRTSQFG